MEECRERDRDRREGQKEKNAAQGEPVGSASLWGLPWSFAAFLPGWPSWEPQLRGRPAAAATAAGAALSFLQALLTIVMQPWSQAALSDLICSPVKAEWNHFHWPPGIFIGATSPSCAYSHPCAKGAFIRGHAPAPRLPNLPNYWGWKGPKGKKKQNPLLGQFSFVTSKHQTFWLCTLPLSNLHADFEPAARSLSFVGCVSEIPLFLLNNEQETLCFFLEKQGRGCEYSCNSSPFLASSSDVQVMQPCSSEGRPALWSRAALYLSVSC